MAQRTHPEAVQAILTAGDNYDTDKSPDLVPFVASASAVVDRVKTCAVTKGLTLSSTELELIERWLAAHMYCMVDQTYASKTTQGASASFHGQTGLNLDGTKYGQQAKLLDYSGCLNAIDKRYFAHSSWLGKPPSTQVDATERGW